MLKQRKITETRAQRFVGLMLAGTIALLAGRAAEAADETYVVDQDAGTDRLGALFRVDAASGHRSLVSDFGNAAQGPLSDNPFGLALEAAGTVLVIDQNAGTSIAGALFRIDRLRACEKIVASDGRSRSAGA